MSTDNVNVKFTNFVKIQDINTGEILVDDTNDVHPQNMARVIARGLAGEIDSNIFKIGLGNGGTYIDGAGVLKYQNANTVGIDASLYNETYFEVVDGTVGNGNSITSTASLTNTTSLVTINLILDSNEPTGQWLTDTNAQTNPDNPLSGGYSFEFDELGCFAKNPEFGNVVGAPEFLLLTHLVFHPMAKTQNRQLQLTYTLTVSVS